MKRILVLVLSLVILLPMAVYGDDTNTSSSKMAQSIYSTLLATMRELFAVDTEDHLAELDTSPIGNPELFIMYDHETKDTIIGLRESSGTYRVAVWDGKHDFNYFLFSTYAISVINDDVLDSLDFAIYKPNTSTLLDDKDKLRKYADDMHMKDLVEILVYTVQLDHILGDGNSTSSPEESQRSSSSETKITIPSVVSDSMEDADQATDDPPPSDEIIHDGMTFKLLPNNTLSLISSDVKTGELIIPSSVNGIPVTEIERCFEFPYGSDDSIYVSIPDTIEYIKEGALQSQALKTVVSNNTRYVVVDGVLIDTETNCLHTYPYRKPEKAYSIPDGLTRVADSAFAYNDFLEEVSFPDTITEIGAEAFYACENLNLASINSQCNSIGHSAFALCKSIKYIKIPDNLTNLEKYLFYDCLKLNYVDIPAGVVRIDGEAFYGCDYLEYISIPDTITHIEENAFDDNPKKEPTFLTNEGSHGDQYAKKKNFNTAPLLQLDSIGIGSKGEAVRLIQQYLSYYDYDVGSPDGSYGNKTHSAVTKYLEDSSIPKMETLNSFAQQAFFGDATLKLLSLNKSKYKKFTYKDLQRNADSLYDEKAFFKGRIFQVVDDGGLTAEYLIATEGRSGNLIYAELYDAEFYPKWIEGDSVSIYATISGTETYTNAMWVEKTVPSVYIDHIEFAK